MTRQRLRVLVAALLAWCVAAAGTAQPCLAQIRINEILADPGIDWNHDGTVSFKDDEWVEIVNAGTAPVALDDYRLSDGGTRVLRFGYTGILAPGAVRVVYGNDSVTWETANSLSTVGLSLNNTGDIVRLWHVVGADTLLVDSYTYVAFEVLDDRSTARVPDGGETWRLFDALNPYTGTTPPLGTGCNPTPGSGNHCPTAIQPQTWGRVKHLYGNSPASH
jgi:hypothetical protein